MNYTKVKTMIYHVVLVGHDGFTKEDEMISKDDKIPPRLFISKKTGNIGLYPTDSNIFGEQDLRKFYLITSFYGLGKNIIVFKEIA